MGLGFVCGSAWGFVTTPQKTKGETRKAPCTPKVTSPPFKSPDAKKNKVDTMVVSKPVLAVASPQQKATVTWLLLQRILLKAPTQNVTICFVLNLSWSKQKTHTLIPGGARRGIGGWIPGGQTNGGWIPGGKANSGLSGGWIPAREANSGGGDETSISFYGFLGPKKSASVLIWWN